MQRSGYATLRLHYGSAPPWLFGRMVSMGKCVMESLVDNYGQDGVLERISNTYFFQSLSNALGFDWNSSGTTTVLCGVLQQVFSEKELGLKIAGGKGSKSRKTQQELVTLGDEFSFTEKKIETLKYSSRMTAKVDNTAIQAGYQLYHHCMIVSEKGDWGVVQQGMNPESKMARRYHWLSDTFEQFAEEPHQAIVCDVKHEKVLDLTSKQSMECKNTLVELSKENPEKTRKMFETIPKDEYTVPKRMDWNAVERAFNLQPENFENLLSVEGVGPATIRGLTLISQLIYGQEPSWKDPVKYSFAFGGKDGVPFPVKRQEYDQATRILEDAIKQSKLGDFEKIKAIKRLNAAV